MRTVLVVSTRLTSARRAAFEGLVGSEGRLEFADPVSGRAWTDRADVDAVVFDGPGASARQGAVPPEMTAVAIGCGIDGARPTDALPLGEIVACVCNPEHPLTARVDTEFPLVDAFAPIDVSDDSFTPVLTVGYRFLDRPVVVVNGRIVVSGVGNTDEALADPRLVTVLRRARSPMPRWPWRCFGPASTSCSRSRCASRSPMPTP